MTDVAKQTETGHAHHRRRRGHRPQGHAADPGRRADGHRDPPVLRPPAAGPGRRLPAVPGRGGGPAQAGRLLHPDRAPTAWWSGPSSPRRWPRRRRRGSWSCSCSTTRWTARCATRAASARCRTRRCRTGRTDSPLPRAQAGVPEADADQHPGAAGPRAVRALPALHPVLRGDRRRQVHRPDGAGRPPSRSTSTGTTRTARGRRGRRPVQLLLLRQHRADLPGRRADRRASTGSGPARSTWSPRPSVCEHCSAGCAQRTDWRRGKVHAPAGRRRPGRSTRSGTATRAGGASSTPRAVDRLTTPLVRDDEDR